LSNAKQKSFVLLNNETTKHFKLVFKSFNISGTLQIQLGFQCKLKQFILAASTVRTIDHYFNVLVSKRREEINRKKRAGIVSNLSHDKK